MAVQSSGLINFVSTIVESAQYIQNKGEALVQRKVLDEIDAKISEIASDCLADTCVEALKNSIRGRLQNVHSFDDLANFQSYIKHNVEGIGSSSPEHVPSRDCNEFMFSGINVSDPNVWENFASNPESHPEYIYFFNEMNRMFNSEGVVVTENDIQAGFTLLMLGVKHGVKNPDDTENPYYEMFMDQIKSLDENNVMYQEIREDMRDRSASLWSGGVAVSEYARDEFRVLETCNIGHLFNNFTLHPNWAVQKPLWPMMSKGFVSNFVKQELEKESVEKLSLHYHARCDDPTSIAFKHEIPQAARDVVEATYSERVEFSISLVPLCNNGCGDIIPIIPRANLPVDLSREWNDQVDDFRMGMEPLHRALAAIHEISINVSTVAARYSCGETAILDLCEKNSYAIRNHTSQIASVNAIDQAFVRA